MVIKIENKVGVREAMTTKRNDFQEFVTAVKALRPGQSFLYPRIESNHRLALSVAKCWLGGVYATSTEGNAVRVSRTQ